MNWIPLEIDAKVDGNPVTLKLDVNLEHAGKIQIRLTDGFRLSIDEAALKITSKPE